MGAGFVAFVGKVVAWWQALGPAVQFAIKVVGAAVLSTAVSRLTAKKFKGDGGRFSKDVTVVDTVFPHTFVYGEAVAGGLIAYSNVYDDGSNGIYLYYLVVHAAHQVEEFNGFYFDDTLLEDGSEFTWAAGEVTSGKYDPVAAASVELYQHKGSGVNAFLQLTTNFPTDITSNHNGQGKAQVLYKFIAQEGNQELWEAGPPRSIRARVKGMLIYDPRLDTTQVIDNTTSPETMGSGAHRINDDTTWAWSENPVLCARDYMGRYMGFADDRFDWTYISNNADICDADVPVPPTASPENTQKRYTCNGVGNLSKTHEENLSEILSSCLGYHVKVNGLWRIFAGGYQTPSVTLTEDDIAGQVVLAASFTSTDRYNKVGSVYISSEHQHLETDALTQEESAYLTRDNSREIRADLKLPYTNDEYQAQRLQFYHLHQGNQQKVVSVPLRWTGLRLAPGDGASFTYDKYSFSAKAFRCIEWQYNPGGGAPFEVRLREDSASAWADPEVVDYKIKRALGVATIATPEAIPPSAFTATARGGAVLLEWVLEEPLPDFIRLYASATSAWSGRSLIYEGLNTSYLHGVDEGDVQYYWGVGVRAGVEGSIRIPDSDTSTVTATAEYKVSFIEAQLGSIDFNPSMTIPTQVVKGSPSDGIGPAGYITNGATQYVHYYDEDTREVAIMGANTATFNRVAIRANPDTTYEVSARVRMETTTTDMDLRAEELDTDDMPDGKFFVGFSTHANGMQARTRLADITLNHSTTTSWTWIRGDYTPTSTAKWFSVSLYNSGTSNAYRIDQVVIRDKSTLGATLGTDVTDETGSVVGDGVIVRATAFPTEIFWTTSEAGEWSPAVGLASTSPEGVRTVTVQFWKGATVISSRLLDATIDDAAPDEGDVSVTAGTLNSLVDISPGEANSVSITGNNSSGVKATVTHTATGVEIDVGFGSVIPGYIGGPGK